MMLDQTLEDKFNLKYYSFLEENPDEFFSHPFNISNESFYKNSYYYQNREEFNKILSTLINYNFKKKTFKKDAFFTFLENENFGITDINTLKKNMIHQIQNEVDEFMISKFNCFFKKEHFYQKNNPFKSNKEFHFFIISRILENLYFDPYYGSFSTENEFYLLGEYFDKVMLQLKEKFDLLKVEDLHREVIRLEILKEKHHFYFLDSSIKKLESLIVRLNSRSDKIKREKDKFKLNISPQKLSKLYLLFFENNNTHINEEKVKRINQFIFNCFVFDSKYSAITNTHKNTSKSIDFLNRKNFKPFIAILILLIKLKYVDEKVSLNIQKVLLKDLKEINKENIGLSTNLRSVISQEVYNYSKKDLLKLTNFKNITKIKSVVNF